MKADQTEASFYSGQAQTTDQVLTKLFQLGVANIILKQGATIEELVRALASIGSTPRDIIAILQNLRAAGALEAELQVI